MKNFISSLCVTIAFCASLNAMQQNVQHIQEQLDPETMLIDLQDPEAVPLCHKRCTRDKNKIEEPLDPLQMIITTNFKDLSLLAYIIKNNQLDTISLKAPTKAKKNNN